MTTALQANNSLAVLRDDKKFIILLIPHKLKSWEGLRMRLEHCIPLKKALLCSVRVRNFFKIFAAAAHREITN